MLYTIDEVIVLNKKIRDYGLTIGDMKTGKNNSITDVEGVTVGHKTLDNGEIKTGITAILPHNDNLFKHKVVAASHVINGFGKSTGLIQIDEIGTIETPIVLTNTLSVGAASEGVIQYMLESNKDIGRTTGSINPVIGECNDGVLNDIRAMKITKEDVIECIKNTGEDFLQGNVGAGTGMVCFDLKGGIGSSSRLVTLDNKDYTVGILVLSNYGTLNDLVVNKKEVGKIIKKDMRNHEKTEDKGSIMIILATDIPVLPSHLKRLLKRTQNGIARTGAYNGNGSGDVAIGFSTANIIDHYSESSFYDIKTIRNDKIDHVFKATVEATEEAILNSMVCSNTSVGRDNKEIKSLRDYIDKLDLF